MTLRNDADLIIAETTKSALSDAAVKRALKKEFSGPRMTRCSSAAG